MPEGTFERNPRHNDRDDDKGHGDAIPEEELERQAAERLYSEALSLRNQSYLIAQNQQSYLALFVAPTLPQASLYPNRLRSIITVIASAALIWFVGMLTVYAIRDHLM